MCHPVELSDKQDARGRGFWPPAWRCVPAADPIRQLQTDFGPIQAVPTSKLVVSSTGCNFGPRTAEWAVDSHYLAQSPVGSSRCHPDRSKPAQNRASTAILVPWLVESAVGGSGPRVQRLTLPNAGNPADRASGGHATATASGHSPAPRNSDLDRVPRGVEDLEERGGNAVDLGIGHARPDRE